MNKFSFRRCAAALLSLVLICTLCAPIAAAAEDPDVIHISTREDWEQLAADCRLDVWSVDKTVLLDNDLDLNSVSPLPTFGGVFDGQGHTITGFRIVAEGDHQGLIRFIQKTGHVRNLTLSANISPQGSGLNTTGGLAGVNSGVVENCSFRGFVTGGSAVGGIVGYNGAGGRISGCRNLSGMVTGEHSTGGVVGVNYGSVVSCTNEAQINTRESDFSPSAISVNWDDLNSSENMPACTDTGGIAGYSGGVVRNCSNQGAVGFAHTGYNVGGIVGRQSGYMSGCTNSGTVLGRKEVGGIVGQMEPYTLLRYEEDTLHKLSRELETLNSLVDEAVRSTDGTRTQLSSHITALTDQTDAARDQISGLLDDVEELGDGTVDTVNELSRRVNLVIDRLGPVSEQMEDSSDLLTQSIDKLEYSVDVGGVVSDDLNRAVTHFRKALEQVDQARRTILTGVPVPLDDLVDEDAPETSSQRLREALEHSLAILSSMADYLPQATTELEEAWTELESAVSDLEDSHDDLEWAGDQMSAALSKLSSSSSKMNEAVTGLKDAVQEQSELPDLEFPKLPDRFHQKEDALSDTLGSLSRELEAMNQTANLGGDTLSASLRAINRQFNAVTRVLTDPPQEDEDRVVDVSDENIASTSQGKVEGCRNLGTVEGDVNIGGVAGSMAIEYDFDPEDDVADQGDRSLHYHFLTRVILLDCVNQGAVTSRKDCVGGLIGRMDLGVTAGCENYGSVTSSSGQYVGGVAGRSDGVIRNCSAKCSLSGLRRIGGISGYAADLRACRSMVEINPDATSRVGAIAGEMSEDATLTDNIFVSDILGGVDGISYFGKAAPVPYGEFAALADLPEGFRSLSVTFTAGDETVAVISVPYHGAVPADQIPAVPEREGFRGSWSDFERDRLSFDARVEAVYTPLLSTLSVPDGSLLAEGSFSGEDALTLSPAIHESPADGAEALSAACTAPMTAVRVRLPEGARDGRLMLCSADGSWTQAETAREGSFLRAELEEPVTELEFCLIPSASHTVLWIGLGAVGAVLLAGGLLLRRRRKHAGQKKDGAPRDEAQKTAD